MYKNAIETKLISGQWNIDTAINTYLSLGWIIIDKWVVGCGSPYKRDETINILLGWFNSDTPPVHPPKPDPSVF
jgi:hypothetical protein